LSPPYRPSPARPLPPPVPRRLAAPLPVRLRPDAASVQSCSASVVSHHPGGFLRACGAGLLHPAADGGSPRFARMDPPVFTRRTGTRGPRDAFRTPRRTPLVCSRTVSPRPLPSCLSRQISRHRAPERSLEHGYRRGRIRSVPANRGFRIPLADPSRLPTLRSAVGPGRAPRGPAHPRTRGCGVDAHPRIPSLESRMRRHAGAPAPIGCPTCAGVLCVATWAASMRRNECAVLVPGELSRRRWVELAILACARYRQSPADTAIAVDERSRHQANLGTGHGMRTSRQQRVNRSVEVLWWSGKPHHVHISFATPGLCCDPTGRAGRTKNAATGFGTGDSAQARSRDRFGPDGLGAFGSERASLHVPAFGSERTSASGAPASRWEMSRIRQAGCVPLAGSPSAAPSREARCRVSPFAPSLAGDRLQGLSPPTSP
jgi:hypothetical protein